MLKRLSKFLPYKPLQTLQKQLQSCWADDIDHVTLAVALKCCSRDLKSGAQIHGLAISSGLHCFVTVSNALMNMYCKSGHFNQAFFIFETVQYPDVVSWNTILSGFDHSDEAIEFVVRMHFLEVKFDAVTYSTALAFCSNLQLLPFGLQLHSLALKAGFGYETFVGNSLISLYSRCSRLGEAKTVFDEMTGRDLVSWNAILCGCTQEGTYGYEGIWIFVDMLKDGFEPDHVSFSSVLSACGHERSLELGKQVHGLVIRMGCETHLSVSNVLISMYSKCGLDEEAKIAFANMVERNVISWTTMISIDEANAVSLFKEMQRDQVHPNEVTFVGLIHALSTDILTKEGAMMHGLCVKTRFSSDLNVANCLITMYAKFKSMEDSKKVFDELNDKEIISWNAVISGYTQNGLFQEALKIFQLMIHEFKPTQFTFGSLLSAIASAEDISLMHGRCCHCHIIKAGLDIEPVISCALINMYAKRGSIEESQSAFEGTLEKNLVVWTAIISAHSRHGNFEHVLNLFREMKQDNVVPDSITFLAVLTACGRRGMVDTGCQVFDSMVKIYKIKPSAKHFACMVDMLGRAGRLEEAEEFVKRIPEEPGLSTLQSLLGACRVHGDMEMGKRIGEALMKLEPLDPGVYVSMSNMYAESGEWEKVAKIRKGMRDKGVKKEIGFSWVDVGNADRSTQMHGFSSDDRSHPRAEEIYNVTKCLGLEMRFLEIEKVARASYSW